MFSVKNTVTKSGKLQKSTISNKVRNKMKYQDHNLVCKALQDDITMFTK